MEFYSQFDQDKFLYENYFNGTRNGTFLDIGSQAGICLSNTYFFEKEMGWSGICVEADPEVFVSLSQNRTCICENAILYDESRVVDFVIMKKHKYMQGVIDDLDEPNVVRNLDEMKREVIQVKAVTVMEILDKHQMHDFDYCSLDTEGSELKILAGMDFDRVNIKAFTIECKGDKVAELYDLMDRLGYKLVKSHNGVEHFFVKRDMVAEC